MDLGERGLGGGWIQLAQNRGLWWAVVNTAMNLRVLAKNDEIRSKTNRCSTWM
jgi:hypothetical protein